jgi:hypothetical protein
MSDIPNSSAIPERGVSPTFGDVLVDGSDLIRGGRLADFPDFLFVVDVRPPPCRENSRQDTPRITRTVKIMKRISKRFFPPKGL